MNSRSLACLAFFLLSLAGCSPKEATDTPSVEVPMKLTGEAAYRERIAVPPNAQVEILLEDVSRADAPAKIIGSQTLTNAGQPPYAFSIDYLPSELVAGHRYNLRARLTVDNKLLFTTDQSYPVFVEGQENQTKLLMRRVPRQATASETAAKSPIATSELANTYWKLTSLNGKEVTVGKRQREPHLIFASDMRVRGSDGCNNLGGSYTVNGSEINFSQMVSTQRACIEGGEQAHEFTMALNAIKGYQIKGDRLELLDENGVAITVFTAVALQ